MDRPHWPQEIVVKPMEEIVLSNTTNSITNNINLTKPSSSSSSFERKLVRPQKAASVNCPRCDSTNTKFCYYNNYSLSQPRYFCKTCRRYWTEGGTLRNIPVGGGSRKNKRSSSSSTSSLSSLSKKLPDLIVPSGSTLVLSQNPRIHHHDHYGQDLNLGFASTNNFKNVSDFIQVPNFDATMNTNSSPSTTSSTTTTASASAQLSALELLTSISTRGTNTMINGLMPTPIHDHNQVYSTSGQMMFPMPEFKIPSLRFSLDGMTSGGGGGGGGGGGVYGSTLNESMDRRLLFPFEELKTNTSTTTHGDPHVGQEREHNGDSGGFWHGMMGGGSW